MRPALFAALIPLAVAPSAVAGDLTIVVRDAAGQPVKDAVTSFKASAAPPAATPIKFTWPYRVSQQNIAFDPFVLVVPVGSDVAFPNNDKVRHHVYSFSPAKKFQLKLYGREENRTVNFDKPGVIALGCNIHDQMVAFVMVVDTPHAAKTDASGQAVLRNVPTGSGRLTVWHPYMKAVRNETVKPLSVAAGGGRETLAVDLRPAPANHKH